MGGCCEASEHKARPKHTRCLESRKIAQIEEHSSIAAKNMAKASFSQDKKTLDRAETAEITKNTMHLAVTFSRANFPLSMYKKMPTSEETSEEIGFKEQERELLLAL